MNGLSLCAGIGGMDLGLHRAQLGYRTICYVEIEPYRQDILLARMEDGVLDRAPIWGDLKQFDARPWRGLIDLVHGGYPCQPFSVAGRRTGARDPRNLWPEIERIIGECEPKWCFFENVPGHLSLGFHVVARDLDALGYRVAAGLFTATEVGASHKRQRLFILAHRNGQGWADVEGGEGQTQPKGWQESLSNNARPRLLGWALEPNVDRVVYRVPRGMDRLKALGNAVVPDVVALAWRTLRGALDAEEGHPLRG